jgi:cell division protein FtsQ
MAALDGLRQHIAEHPWRAGLYAFGALAAVTAVLVAADTLLRPETFPVRSVSFEGEFKQVDERALTAAMIDTVRGGFFLLDLDAVRRRAQGVPWVHEVTVRRRWPDGVYLRFSEQQLAARWGASGWVNVQGEYVDLQGRAGPEGLPRLNGPDGMQARVLEHYRNLNEILAPVGLQIATLTLTPRHSWSVQLDNGLTLTLGREAPEPKVARFARVYPKALALQAARIKRVDLRYTNGFSVEWDPRAGAARHPDLLATGHNEG